MLEILILLVVAYAAYNIGGMVAHYRMRHIIYDEAKRRGIALPKELENIDKPEISPTVCKLVVEKVEDMLYMYDAEKHDFICQAKSFDDLADLAYKIKKIKHAVVVDPETLNVYAFVEGKVIHKA